MAINLDTITATASISPVVTSGTGNDVNNVRAFQKLRALADTRNVDFYSSILNTDDDIAGGFSNNELLSLNSQSLDILNGVTPTTSQQGLVASVNPATVQQEVSIAPETPASYLALDQLQRENLSSIISEYSNSPFDQNTFLQIQNALVAARINPQQVSLQAILQEVFNGAVPTPYYGRNRMKDQTFEVEAA